MTSLLVITTTTPTPHTPAAAIEALPEVVRAVGSSAEVYLDGGVMRGTDVIKVR